MLTSPFARDAALIEAGYDESTPLEALTPGSVTRTLDETFARELAKLYEHRPRGARWKLT